MHGTMALSRRVPITPASSTLPNPGQRGSSLLPSSLQGQQQLSLRKQCIYLHQQQHFQEGGNYIYEGVPSLRQLSPGGRDYERLCIPENEDIDSCYRADRCLQQERYPRPLSPVSRGFHSPSPLPRSLSRGSSRSCQSSSADESGREGGASSSGIGLSGSSANSSRRASSCSSGTGGSKMAFHANILSLEGGNISLDGSLDSRLNLNGSELTVKNLTLNSNNSGTNERNLSQLNDERSHPVHTSDSFSQRAQSIDSLENELTCPICLDLYHDPVLLPCAHNLCAGCVDRLSLSNHPGGQPRDFQCPTCREIVNVGQQGISLRRNLTVQNIVERYRQAAATMTPPHGMSTCSDYDVSSGDETSASNNSGGSDGNADVGRNRRRSRTKEQYLSKRDYSATGDDDKVSCQFCEINPPRDAVKTCLTCRAYYCDKCLRVTHPKKKPFINHKLIPATPGSAGTLSNNRKTPMIGSVYCTVHPQDPANLYCYTCEVTLCKGCSSNPGHDCHRIASVAEWLANERIELDSRASEAEKMKKEIERSIDKLLEACQQTEINANSQEAKLNTECEMLLRVIQERKEAISTRINESKTVRLNKLNQQVSEMRICLGQFDTAVAFANETSDHSSDHGRFVKNVKPAFDRLNETMTSSMNVITNQEKVELPGYCFDFSQEKVILEKLNIMEAPAPPRICEELCTQSHDKITIQWRAPDHLHTDSYELQYAVDNSNALSSGQQEGWMIVPNIKECHYTIYGLQSGTQYVFAVRASNKAGSSRSECWAVKTPGVPFIFDTHSMHKKLRLANHGYTVARDDTSKKSKEVGVSSFLGVTGNADIECGRHYWEVVVCQSNSFTIGVAYSNVSRYDWVGSNNSSWCLCRINDDWTARHGGKEVPVDMPIPFPKKIGIKLDFDIGSLSFYDGASGCHIHSFHVKAFAHSLRPAFAIGSKSLTINTGITLPDHLQVEQSC